MFQAAEVQGFILPGADTGSGDKLLGWLRPLLDARFLEMELAIPTVVIGRVTDMAATLTVAD
jgi:hypothetical protein